MKDIVKKSKKISKIEIEEIYRDTLENHSPILAYYFYRKISFPISLWLSIHTCITPNQITIFKFVFVILATVLIISGKYSVFILAVFFIFLSMLADFIDGELARLKKMETKFGKWLDGNTDMYEQIFLYFGLALGYYHQSGNIDALFLLSILLASRFFLNFIRITTQLIFDPSIFIEIGTSNFYRVGKWLRIKPNFLAFSDDIKYLIFSVGILVNQLRYTMILFIIIHFTIWFLVVKKIVKKEIFNY